jgi:hypothetical protein
VKFDTRENMLSSKERVVQQFLTGSVDGPIGMSEEKDAGGGEGAEERIDTDIDDPAARRIKAEVTRRKERAPRKKKTSARRS